MPATIPSLLMWLCDQGPTCLRALLQASVTCCFYSACRIELQLRANSKVSSLCLSTGSVTNELCGLKRSVEPFFCFIFPICTMGIIGLIPMVLWGLNYLIHVKAFGTEHGIEWAFYKCYLLLLCTSNNTQYSANLRAKAWVQSTMVPLILLTGKGDVSHLTG